MNAYATQGLLRIHQRDVASIHSTHSYLNGATLAALERQRGWRGDAEAEWLLKQHGISPASAASLVEMLWRSIGAALVRAGQCLAAASPRGASPGTASVSGANGTSA